MEACRRSQQEQRRRKCECNVGVSSRRCFEDSWERRRTRKYVWAVVERIAPLTNFVSAASGIRSELLCCRTHFGKRLECRWDQRSPRVLGEGFRKRLCSRNVHILQHKTRNVSHMSSVCFSCVNLCFCNGVLWWGNWPFECSSKGSTISVWSSSWFRRSESEWAD